MPAIIRNGHIYGASPMFPIGAGDIDYNNTSSELESTNIQDAVDELKGIIDANPGTTYTLDTDGNNITLTPSDGQTQSITAPYATSAGDASTVNGKTVATNVPADAVFTDTTYENATTSADGLMSSTDKGKVDALGTASTKNVPTSGNASTTEVVMGNDTRLTDARPASDVSSWAKASTKPSYTASEVGAIATTAKGSNNGVAELDSTGKVPSNQLPSFVDDVLEYDKLSDFPATGESGKIYVAKDTNKSYRWSGTTYVEISASLALGETSTTAFRGDHGKTAYDHASDANKLTTAQSSGLYKIATTSEGHIASVTAVTKSDITTLGIPGEDTNTTYALSVGSGADANKIVLTPSSGTANKITVPYATSADNANTVNSHSVASDVPANAVFTDTIDAANLTYSNTTSGLTATKVQDAIDEVVSNFQDGVDDVYDAVVAKGSTPASKSLSDVVTGISAIPNSNSGTYAITSNGVKDMGATNSYRYCNINVPNSNSGTYTYASGSTGGTVDMGATNSYRYVNATNVYNKGKADGKGDVGFTQSTFSVSTNGSSFSDQGYLYGETFNRPFIGTRYYRFSAGKYLLIITLVVNSSTAPFYSASVTSGSATVSAIQNTGGAGTNNSSRIYTHFIDATTQSDISVTFQGVATQMGFVTVISIS